MRQFAILHVCGWLAMGYLIHRAEYREAVYWSLCCVYTIAVLNFQRRLAHNSTGKLAIVTGFTIWSLCLLLHPWIVMYRAYAEIASHIWNMQKSSDLDRHDSGDAGGAGFEQRVARAA